MKKLIIFLTLMVGLPFFASASYNPQEKYTIHTDKGQVVFYIQNLLPKQRALNVMHWYEKDFDAVGYTRERMFPAHVWVYLGSKYYTGFIVIVPTHKYRAFKLMIENKKTRYKSFRYVTKDSDIKIYDLK